MPNIKIFATHNKLSVECKKMKPLYAKMINDDKNAIEISDGEHLLKALNQVKDAVIAGELDSQIESAANTVKARFKK
jgi:hypothetical protein